ncbi:sigma-54-dependent transcriptional regulator [Paraflavitalea pollutisoli]|uniref:sigma-54-dependent transcriptional regulator n=1 Tax=Paraflavitalea pollutisoli TaxID=3034143 RepID=UPI0023EE010C|nr:sigma-54 dependent transcriptional regulator [Paraflavitalea sp. H1-2-19X]
MNNSKEKLLIVEDEFIVGNDLRMMLIKGGHEVVGMAASVEQARKLIEAKKPDWVLLDIVLKTPTSGIELGKELHAQKIPFLYISANTNEQTLEAAKATQPYGFLVKPFRQQDLFVMLDIARYRYGIEKGTIKEVAAPATTHTPVPAYDSNDLIGNSAVIHEALNKVNAVAPTTTSVLLLGESGTGKERFAEAIHKRSNRKNKPFIVVNCGAIPITLLESELFGHERGAFTGANQKRIGKFEQAEGGTLFLDEIGELPPEAQVKLLRVLQQKEIERVGGDRTIPVDVRVIAATNRHLEKEVAHGRFRLDLYYRLNVFPIVLPPLRERPDDIPSLVQYFLHKFRDNSPKGIPAVGPQAMQSLTQYNWPGNIRELEHVIERQVILSGGNPIEHIELTMADQSALPTDTNLETLETVERNHILKTLKACKGRVSGMGGAAEILGIPAQTLYSKMKKLGIKTGYL